MTIAEQKHSSQTATSAIDLAKFGPIELVVLQPTSFCNLNCDYCYLPDRQLKNTLSLDLIDPIFQAILTSRFLGEYVTICWHAGEPLAIPISFYDSALAIIKQAEAKYKTKPCEVRHSLQTNGTLINQSWCDCFKRHDIAVGVSLDGPAFIHDAHRQTRQGMGTHANTMRGISFLQKNDLYFNIIAVITQESLDYPEEIFNFFIDNGIDDVGFNMEEIEGVNQKSSLDNQNNIERFRAFIQRFWALTVASQGKLKVREFESICSLIYTGQRLQQTDMNAPFVIVSIDHQGNFSTFDPELLSVESDLYGRFLLGNVLTDTFESVCYTEKFKKIYQDMTAGIKLCRDSCQYFGLCGGGAGSNKYWENGTFNSAVTMACTYRNQIITDVVLGQLESSFGLG